MKQRRNAFVERLENRTLLSVAAIAPPGDASTHLKPITISADSISLIGQAPAATLSGEAGNVITGFEGTSTGTVLLGTFTDSDQSATVANFTSGGGSVVVNWGDGAAPQTLAAGNLISMGVANSVEWTLNAAHTYVEQGTYAYTITVTSSDGGATIVSGSAVIADAQLTEGTAVDLTATAGTEFSGMVGRFTDENVFAPISDFSALIDWGDGTGASLGRITQPGGVGTNFQVDASHTYAAAGTYNTQIDVTDDGGSTVTIFGTATVSAAPTYKLAFAHLPGSFGAGTVKPPIVVDVESLTGRILTGDSSDVTLSIASGPGSLGGTVTEPAIDGVATFSDVAVDTPGAYTLKAADGIVTDTSKSLPVTAGAVAEVAVAPIPASVTAGSAISPNITVHLYDAFGNPVGGSPTVTLTVLTGPAGGTLHGSATAAAQNGIATFGDVSMHVAGVYTLRAAHGSITEPSSSITVTPAAAAKVTFSEPPSSVHAGSPISSSLVVQVTDKFGNLLTNNTNDVTLILKSGPSGGVLGGTTSVALSGGQAVFSNLDLTVDGSYTLTASFGGLSQKLSFKVV